MKAQHRNSLTAKASPVRVMNNFPDVQQVRDAIPAHCFQPSTRKSLYYILRDFLMMACLSWAALTGIPQIQNSCGWAVAWMCYGFTQGLVCTGIWVLAHECGHGALFARHALNDVFGWIMHSFLLVPYFSWKSSHQRHHRFTSHLTKDVVFVPPTSDGVGNCNELVIMDVRHLIEDTPSFQTCRLLVRQLFGWQAYLIFGATAGRDSWQRKPGGFHGWLRVSHFDPTGALFRRSEAIYVLLSDVGLCITLFGLFLILRTLGSLNTFLLYFFPYFWVHHWLVAITYLHHNHRDAPHYSDQGWTYVKGALSTVDRDFGFIGKHFFHLLIETHVVHHLFPRIPFYKAEEATQAIKPILGDLYLSDNQNFLIQLWQTFRSLRCVEADPKDDGVMRWKT